MTSRAVHSRLRATLVGDGGTERVLLSVLKWLLRQVVPDAVEVAYADLRSLALPPRSLRDRSRTALQLYPADLLFIHRDAEGEPAASRLDEIHQAVENEKVRYVAVVPVRMTEAWLLFDEPSIRLAAGNPNGSVALKLPPVRELADLPDPKQTLHASLITASELSTRRRAMFRVGVAVHRLADVIDDFSPLRALAAFCNLEDATRAACARWHAERG